jgi:amino acid adenylation domain-containing protein
MPASDGHGLLQGFLDASARHPGRAALAVDGVTYSYAELRGMAASVAQSLRTRAVSGPVVVAALRSRTAYAAMLGILAHGGCYVPVNGLVPVARASAMLDVSGATAIITDDEAAAFVAALAAVSDARLTIFHAGTYEWPVELHTRHNVVPVDLDEAIELDPQFIDSGDTAYILFTSGTTGIPKAVPLSHGNACTYLRNVRGIVPIDSSDACSQVYDLTFDFSVHEIFASLGAGACVAVVPQRELRNPAPFLKRMGVTMFCSLPSLVHYMARMRLLRAGDFPAIRHTYFLGEPLTVGIAQSWAEAAPNSVIDNFYGPTEATTAVSHHRWDRSAPEAHAVNGIVSLGRMFPGERCAIIDEAGRIVGPGATGELCLAGGQVVRGYLHDTVRTHERFVALAHDPDSTWYRTGDLASVDESGLLYFHGRADHQVKLKGYRVELQEIEHAVKQLAHADHAVAVAWPVRDGMADGVSVFLTGETHTDSRELKAACADVLPDYMIPNAFFWLDVLPATARGKIDIQHLQKLLELPHERSSS